MVLDGDRYPDPGAGDPALDAAAVHARAELLPEERASGPSVDPEAQALAILEESEQRVNARHDVAAELDPFDPEYQEHEHRRSEETL